MSISTSPRFGPRTRLIARPCCARMALMLGILVATTAAAQTELDFGDAPDASVGSRWSYPTLLADNGARHLVPASPTHLLGGAPIKYTVRVSLDSTGVQSNHASWTPSISAEGRFVAFRSMATNLVPGDTNGQSDVFVHGEYFMLDAEPDGAPTALAIGDDEDGNDDEDGVHFLCCMYPGETADVLIDASAAGFVNAWIDFNGDGDWGDGGERILTDHAVAAGTSEISYPVPAGGAIPTTYARVRFTSYDPAGTLGVNGLASDGEVEDYSIDGTPLFADDFETGNTTEWSVTVP